MEYIGCTRVFLQKKVSNCSEEETERENKGECFHVDWAASSSFLNYKKQRKGRKHWRKNKLSLNFWWWWR